MKRIVNNMTKEKKTSVALIFTIIGTILVLCLDPFNWFYNREIYRNELGGSMNATYQTHFLNKGETKNIVVCLEDNAISLNELPITPTFENPGKYSLKDFSLSFEAECANVTLTPSSFFDEFKLGENRWSYKYINEKLPSFNETETPFSCIQLNGSNGHCFIKSKASYNGIQSAFDYYINVWFFVEPNMGQISYNDWKTSCKKRIMDSIGMNSCDVYYITNDHDLEYTSEMTLEDGFMNFVDEQHNTISKKNELIVNSVVPEFTYRDDSLKWQTKPNIHYSVSRNDSTIVYVFSDFSDPDSDDSFLVETRIKQRKKHYNYEYKYNIIYDDDYEKTDRIICHYKKEGRTPVIDEIQLYRQSITEDLLKIKKRLFSYVIRNKTDYTVVFCIHDYNDYIAFYVLDGGGKIRVKDLGVQPIEAFNTCRESSTNPYKNANIRILTLYILFICVSVAGVLFLCFNAILFMGELFDSSFDYKNALKNTVYYHWYNYFITHNWREIRWTDIIVFVFLILSLLSPIGLYFCFNSHLL